MGACCQCMKKTFGCECCSRTNRVREMKYNTGRPFVIFISGCIEDCSYTNSMCRKLSNALNFHAFQNVVAKSNYEKSQLAQSQIDQEKNKSKGI